MHLRYIKYTYIDILIYIKYQHTFVDINILNLLFVLNEEQYKLDSVMSVKYDYLSKIASIWKEHEIDEYIEIITKISDCNKSVLLHFKRSIRHGAHHILPQKK